MYIDIYCILNCIRETHTPTNITLEKQKISRRVVSRLVRYEYHLDKYLEMT